MQTEITHKEILFRFYSEVFEQQMEELLWAIELDQSEGLYKIDSLPFYVQLVATNDVVKASYDPDKKHLVYKETVSASGNSTIHVVVTDETTAIEEVRSKFAPFGCVTVKLNEHFFSMEIPATADYAPIKELLDDLEAQELIEYAEPSLSQMHWDQTSAQ